MRTLFIDSGVLIAAARGDDRLSEAALAVLDDDQVRFASSSMVRLEVMPKARYHRQLDEAEFYRTFFESVGSWAQVDEDLVRLAREEAEAAGLSALDALHVAAAVSLKADELVTSEKAHKTIHRVRSVPVRSIDP